MKNKLYFIQSLQMINLLLFVALIGLLLEHASQKTVSQQPQTAVKKHIHSK